MLDKSNSLASKILIQQSGAYERLQHQSLDHKLTDVIAALSLGVKQGVSYELRQWFILTGTGHLLAISGLHIALIAGFLYFLILFLIKPIGVIFLFNHTHSLALIISLIILFFYTLLVGAPIPTMRALIMFCLIVISFVLKRKIFFYYQWWIAAFIVLCLKPMAFFNIGFWFSFLAVLFLYLISTKIIYSCKKWQQYFLSQWLLGFMLLPISLYSFSQFSLSGLLVNLIAIPWVGLIILPLSLLAQVLILFHIKAIYLWAFISVLGDYLLKFLNYFSSIKYLVIYRHASSMAMSMGFMGIFFIVYFKKIKFKIICLLCYLPLFMPGELIARARFKLTALDVGQGLSIVVRTQHHLLVYDTGEKFMSGSDMGQRVVLPYLHFLGKNKIDLLLISHGDNDHIGGANSLIKYARVNNILTSVPNRFKDFKKLKKTNFVDLCAKGQKWQWDGVKFEILYPDNMHYRLGNNSSCVLKITAENISALLTGDIEYLAEKNLVRLNKNLQADILVTPHHGSITSSSELLLNAVQPKIAIISYGYLNKFHFPNPIVLERYKSRGVAIKSTEFAAVLFSDKQSNR